MIDVVIFDVDEGTSMDGLYIEEKSNENFGKILAINGWYDFIS